MSIAISLAQRLLRWERRSRGAPRPVVALWSAGHGLLHASLTEREKRDLTAWAYEAQRPRSATELFAWERRWFESELPKPPARVLVGGAGQGRELSALQALGYQVAGYDPAPALVDRGRCRGLSLHVLDHEGFAAIVARRAEHPLVEQPYDAVLLGWGSLSHVLDSRRRHELFRALARVCPSGPLLMSFQPASAARPGRGDRLGRIAGAPIGWLRGTKTPPAEERLWSHSGFFVGVGPEELERLASASGRRLHGYEPLPYAHATLRPLGADAAAFGDRAMLAALRAALAARGRARVVVRGTSMWPVIWPGCRVWVEATPFGRIGPGDLVLYERGGRPVLHRAVGRRGPHLLVRADRCRDLEPPLEPAEVLGSVRGLAFARWHFSGAPPLLGLAAGRLCSGVLPALWQPDGPFRWPVVARFGRHVFRGSRAPRR